MSDDLKERLRSAGPGGWNAEALARIEALEAQLGGATDMLGDVPGATLAERLTKYIGRFVVQQIQLAEARKALEKFTAHYELWMDEHPDNVECIVHSRHTFGELRRARALSKEPSDD